MEEEKYKEFFCDLDGNEWRLCIEAQEKYPTRYDFKFIFNGKTFRLQQFASARDAENMWDLLCMISEQKKAEKKGVKNAKATS